MVCSFARSCAIPSCTPSGSCARRVSNRAARAFYEQQGANVKSAFECMDTKPIHDEALIMQCRHCIRYSLGYCMVHGGKKPTWKEPLFLELGDKRRFRLEFDCKDCQMNIYAE